MTQRRLTLRRSQGAPSMTQFYRGMGWESTVPSSLNKGKVRYMAPPEPVSGFAPGRRLRSMAICPV